MCYLLLYALGTVLAFLLWCTSRSQITSTRPGLLPLPFSFQEIRARHELQHRLALFALLLLVVGMRKHAAPVRYAISACSASTIGKTFLSRLSQLAKLYRISAFVVVAIHRDGRVIPYQRFLGPRRKSMKPIHDRTGAIGLMDLIALTAFIAPPSSQSF